MDLSRTNVPLILFLSFLLLAGSITGLWLILEAPHAVEGRHGPVISEITPQLDSVISRAHMVEFLFTHPMDHASVQEALIVLPSYSYTLEWETEVQGERLIIVPRESLEYGTRYQVQIGPGARSKGGRPLREPAEARFTTVNTVDVANVSPEDGAKDVELEQPIMIRFNKIIKGMLAGQDQVIRPVTLSPSTRFKGQWSESEPNVYIISPQGQWEAGTEYIVRIHRLVAPGWELLTPFEWEFRTEKSGLTRSFPMTGTQEIKE